MMDKKKEFRELIRYGVAGLSTTLINIGIYQLLLFMRLDYIGANLIALVISKVYGYIINKLFVFRSRCPDMTELIKEIACYITARGGTGLIDYFGMMVLVELFKEDEIISKYIIQVIVIVLNFLFGKFFVFKRLIRRDRGDK